MEMAPQIQFFGGIGTIGGTKIIVREGGYQVLFDFGTAFAPGGDFWGGRLQSRTGAGALRDLAALGYLPALDGIYRPDHTEALGIEPGWDGRTHIFISHLHIDHMALLHLLADDVPVWMHTESLQLLRAIAQTGEQPGVPVDARPFAWGEPIQVGPITVTPVAVDHDIPGASALLIHTSAGTVVYSGDLRLHGPAPDRTRSFVQQARATRPQILLIEGTRLGEPEWTPERPPQLSELQVAPAVAEILSGTPGLALITAYPRNSGRLGRIAEAVKAVGRTLVLSAEAAHVYAAMGGDLGLVAVYRRHRDGAGPLTPGLPIVSAADVRANHARYLLQLFPWDLGEIVDLAPPAGSVFIHSNGEPLGRFDPAYEVFTRWLQRFGIELRYAASTGHATAADLHAMAAEIAPKVLMPIHSLRPELLAVPALRRVLPEVGATYAIATGERIG